MQAMSPQIAVISAGIHTQHGSVGRTMMADFVHVDIDLVSALVEVNEDWHLTLTLRIGFSSRVAIKEVTCLFIRDTRNQRIIVSVLPTA